MSYFAYVPNIVDGKGIVENVIAIEQEQIYTGLWGNPSYWIQTSYNTRNNVHYGQDGQPDGGVALRGNYAGIGDIYDQVNDVFYRQPLFKSWLLDANFTWQPPFPMPTDTKFYAWNEDLKSWVKQIKE